MRSQRSSAWRRMIDERGQRYAKCELSEFDISGEHRVLKAKAVETVGEVCAILERGDPPRSMVFAGPPGTGKDHLMFYALRFAVLKVGLKADWIDGQRFYSELRDGITEGRTEREILQNHIRADVLAISDPVPPMGALTDHQRNMLYNLIDRRYSRMKPIWVTVNASSPAELDHRMGVQLVDRLLHDAVTVNCYWPSYRRAK